MLKPLGWPEADGMEPLDFDCKVTVRTTSAGLKPGRQEGAAASKREEPAQRAAVTLRPGRASAPLPP